MDAHGRIDDCARAIAFDEMPIVSARFAPHRNTLCHVGVLPVVSFGKRTEMQVEEFKRIPNLPISNTLCVIKNTQSTVYQSSQTSSPQNPILAVCSPPLSSAPPLPPCKCS